MIFEENIYPEDIQEKLDAIELIQKGFDSGIVDSLTYQKSLDSLEKAKKDLSKLTTIKKIVHRGGKTFLAIYHVRPDGGFIEDESKSVEVHPDTPETYIGEKVKIYSKTGEVHIGVVHKIDAKGRSGVTQLFLETSPGEFKSITVSKIRKLKSIMHEGAEEKAPPVEPTIKEIPKESPKEAFRPTFKFEEFTKLSDLGGSGGTELFEDKAGIKFTVKKEREGISGQLRDEVISDAIYREMGFNAPISFLEKGKAGMPDKKIAFYSESVKELGSLTGAAKDNAYNEIRKGFVLDCLLANWDVIGSSEDNILCTSDGRYVTRVDNGGSLRYRAKGSAKGSAFSDEVGEIDTFRSDKNPSGKKIYGSITNEEIARQVKEIKDKFPIIEKTLSGDSDSFLGYKDLDLIKKLKTRLSYLEKRFGEKPKVESSVISEYKEFKEKEKLREGMPSLTTQKYFDNGWDSLEIEGVGNIKAAIKSKIIAIEERHRSKIQKWANSSGLDYDAYLDKLQATVNKVVKGSECFIAVHTEERGSRKDVLSKIFDGGGRFKTLFETGTGSGSTSTSCRAGAEYSYFGFPKSTSVEPTKRPVYGYFSPEQNGVINDKGTIPPPNLVSQYGDVSFKLKKDSALKKATITFKDSLGADYDTASTPYAKPHFTSLLGTFNESDPIKFLDENFAGKKNLGKYGYVECQYHGGLSLDHLESLHINPDAYSSTRDSRKVSFAAMNKIINKVNDFVASTGKKSIKIEIF